VLSGRNGSTILITFVLPSCTLLNRYISKRPYYLIYIFNVVKVKVSLLQVMQA